MEFQLDIVWWKLKQAENNFLENDPFFIFENSTTERIKKIVLVNTYF